MSKMYKRFFFISTIVLTLLFTYHLAAQEIYWETPKIFVSGETHFPIARSNGKLLVILWHEIESSGREGKVYLSVKTTRDGKKWKENRRFAGPFTYKGEKTAIASLAVDNEGGIFVAALVGEKAIDIFYSKDEGKSFITKSHIEAASTVVAPRIFLRPGGSPILFVTKKTEEALSIFYSVSSDGVHWEAFKPFVQNKDLIIDFLPYYIHYGTRDYVVFQSVTAETLQRYQLYVKISEDNGETWGSASRIEMKEYRDGKLQSYDSFSNQRPFLAVINGKLKLVWERQFRSTPPQIYYAELDEKGRVKGDIEMVTGGIYSCHYPQLFIYRGEPLILWFDNRRGEDHIIIAKRGVFRWEDKDISNIPGESTFGSPVILNETLYVFWENSHAGETRLYYLEPDRTVAKAKLIPLNFSPKKKYNRDTVKIKWLLPKDPAGIAGVSYSWGLGIGKKVEHKLKLLTGKNRITLIADKDGEWNFNLAVMDYAGNWSEVSTVSYYRDTLPPEKVKIIPPQTDEKGFLISNTFSIVWEPPQDDIAGYTYTLRYLGSEKKVIKVNEEKLKPPARLLTRNNKLSYRNIDNGTYALSVAAIDSAGNIGKQSVILLRLNKYIPVTYITSVNSKKDEFGNVSITLRGRGFSEGGLIKTIVLDRDGKKPFDYTFERTSGAFKVESDRIIDNLILSDVEEGLYHIGVIHPTRGLYMTRPLLKLEPAGTVKFGYFAYKYSPAWERAKRVLYFLSFNELIIWLIVLFLVSLFFIALRKLVLVTREARILKSEIAYMISGKESPFRKEEEMKELKQRGMSLRIKFILLMVILVFLIVLIVSIPLGYYMIDTQKRDLTEGLRKRAEVVLGSLATGSETYLSLSNRLEMALLPNQTREIEEITYATITDRNERIWATNDPDITGKIKGDVYIQTESVIEDEVSPLIGKIADEIDRKARESISGFATEVDKLSAEAKKYILKSDPQSKQKLLELQDAINALNVRITSELKKLGNRVGSIPEFNPENLQPNYILYRPIVYRQPREDFYYHGMVRIGVSTEKILKEIASSRNTLIIQTGIVAMVAIILGIIGAIVLASIIVTPIKKLAIGVAVIRDTEDKEQLKDHRIDIRSRDEIGTLAETVNQMTQALVKAAIASKDLTVGKEIQKMFIPLDPDRSGKKGSTGSMVDDNVEIFGYYEGAKGVSGDYFDYMKLSGDNYAIIKCDVAGKGVPAALIMVEVATIFSTFFKNRVVKNPSKSAQELVYLINDMLEERGFKGRFAALTVCIMNGRSGNGFFCNAGDNIIHIFDSSEGKMVQKLLPEAPAAGVFPTMIVETQSGFQSVSTRLNSGDILILFTDGLEEAKRHFRDSAYSVIKCEEEGLKEGELHGGTHTPGSDGEELGIARIHEIVNAVMNRGEYRLVKYHNPIPDEELVFDFSTCEGTVDEAVMALVAVERVFRLYPDPEAGLEDRIVIDAKVNDFLLEHFLQYDKYFNHLIEQDETSGIILFSHLKEDEQYDDLTILAIKKR